MKKYIILYESKEYKCMYHVRDHADTLEQIQVLKDKYSDENKKYHTGEYNRELGLFYIGHGEKKQQVEHCNFL